MSVPLKAEDLWPLVQKLSHQEQVRLARLALMAASRGRVGHADAYRASPPGVDEFSADEEALAWEAAGWESLELPR